MFSCYGFIFESVEFGSGSITNKVQHYDGEFSDRQCNAVPRLPATGEAPIAACEAHALPRSATSAQGAATFQPIGRVGAEALPIRMLSFMYQTAVCRVLEL